MTCELLNIKNNRITVQTQTKVIFGSFIHKHPHTHTNLRVTGEKKQPISNLLLFLSLLTLCTLFGPFILPNYIWRKSTVPSFHHHTWTIKMKHGAYRHTQRPAHLWQGGYIYPLSDTHHQAETEWRRVGMDGARDGWRGVTDGDTAREREREGGMDGNRLFCYPDLFNDHQVAASACSFLFPFTVSRIHLRFRRAWWWWSLFSLERCAAVSFMLRA